MKVLAAVLIILQALAALGMLALSVHAPSGLASASGIYFAAAAALTWWAVRRKSWILIGAVALATFGAPPGIFALLDLVERRGNETRIAATQVSDLVDEPIVLAGKPVGVRLSFSVIVPERGYFAISPWLYPREEGTRNFQLQPRDRRFDGRGGLDQGPFEAGRRHRLEFDLYPSVLFIDGKGERCLRGVPPGPPQPAPGPLLIDLHDTPVGAPWRGARWETTRGVYDVAAMYRALQENLAPCKVPGQ